MRKKVCLSFLPFHCVVASYKYPPALFAGKGFGGSAHTLPVLAKWKPRRRRDDPWSLPKVYSSPKMHKVNSWPNRFEVELLEPNRFAPYATTQAISNLRRPPDSDKPPVFMRMAADVTFPIVISLDDSNAFHDV